MVLLSSPKQNELVGMSLWAFACSFNQPNGQSRDFFSFCSKPSHNVQNFLSIMLGCSLYFFPYFFMVFWRFPVSLRDLACFLGRLKVPQYGLSAGWRCRSVGCVRVNRPSARITKMHIFFLISNAEQQEKKSPKMQNASAWRVFADAYLRCFGDSHIWEPWEKMTQVYTKCWQVSG